MNAQQYMGHWKKNQVWTHLAWPKHQRRFDLCAAHVAGDTLIDVGCAYGHSTEELARRYPGTWAGLDFTPEAVDRARELFPAYEFFYAPNYDMASAVGDRKFDSVVCSEVIEHLADDTQFVSELTKIARRRMVLTTPNRVVNDPGHLRCYTEAGLARLFNGLDREIISDGPFFYIIVKLDAA